MTSHGADGTPPDPVRTLSSHLKNRYDRYELWWDSLALIFRFEYRQGHPILRQLDAFDYRTDQLPVPAPAPLHRVDTAATDAVETLCGDETSGPVAMVVRFAGFESDAEVHTYRGDEADSWRVDAESWPRLAYELAPDGAPHLAAPDVPTPPAEAVRLWTGSAEDRLRFWLAKEYTEDFPGDGAIFMHVNGVWDWHYSGTLVVDADGTERRERYRDPAWIDGLTVDALREHFTTYTPPIAVIALAAHAQGRLDFQYYDGPDAQWIKDNAALARSPEFLARFNPFDAPA